MIDTFLVPVTEVPFDSRAADRFGKIARSTRGEGIEMADAMSATHALELGLTLVTHNLRHTSQVEGLEIED